LSYALSALLIIYSYFQLSVQKYKEKTLWRNFFCFLISIGQINNIESVFNMILFLITARLFFVLFPGSGMGCFSKIEPEWQEICGPFDHPDSAPIQIADDAHRAALSPFIFYHHLATGTTW
jgi:hypothetical protein